MRTITGRRGTRRVLRVAAASALALTLAGCAGDDDAKKVPSVAGGTEGGAAKTSASAARDDTAAYAQSQRAWVGCLREKGLDVPDPDARGVVTFRDGASLKKDPAFLDAQQKCGHLSMPVPESVVLAQRPTLSPEQIDTRKRYATCMQHNGAPDFPDTGPEGYAVIGAEWNQQSASAQRATRTCAPIIGAPADPPQGQG
jgi:hypothetical protein